MHHLKNTCISGKTDTALIIKLVKTNTKLNGDSVGV